MKNLKSLPLYQKITKLNTKYYLYTLTSDCVAMVTLSTMKYNIITNRLL